MSRSIGSRSIGTLPPSERTSTEAPGELQQAIDSTRPGGRVGYVGVPVGSEIPIRKLFSANITIGGGVAPVRSYIEALLGDVLEGSIDPGKVFDSEMPLEEAAAAYKAMDERTAIKVLLRP